MCHRYEALPAVPPIAGAAVDVEDLTLTASDGVEFAAFHARPETAGGPAIVVLPDVRGLFRFYEELAVRFAEAGVEAVAIDYFGRTAGVGKRDAEFDFWPHVRSTSPEGIAADVAAAAAVLRADDAERALFTVGFCFGGSNSWMQAAAGHGLSGAIGFYGHPTREGPNGGASPPGRVDAIGRPASPLPTPGPWGENRAAHGKTARNGLKTALSWGKFFFRPTRAPYESTTTEQRKCLGREPRPFHAARAGWTSRLCGRASSKMEPRGLAAPVADP